MGQIANQMALELFFKMKEKIKEKRLKRKNKKIKNVQSNSSKLQTSVESGSMHEFEVYEVKNNENKTISK